MTEQELFFETVYADPEMSDADKVRYLHKLSKEYWRRLEWAEKRYAARDAEAAAWAELATTNAAALSTAPPRPEPPATLRDLIRQAEADRDEQSGTAAEEWCGGYLKGLRDALAALTTSPPAAPSVPDAAGVE